MEFSFSLNGSNRKSSFLVFFVVPRVIMFPKLRFSVITISMNLSSVKFFTSGHVNVCILKADYERLLFCCLRQKILLVAVRDW